MANTYDKIATVTAGVGGTSSIDFTSIPSLHTDLKIHLSLRSNASSSFVNESIKLQINSDTTYSNYRSMRAYGDGATSGTDVPGTSSYNGIYLCYVNTDGYTASSFGNAILYFPNYAGSSQKTILADGASETASATAYMSIMAGIWYNTAAITSLSIKPLNGSLWKQYSTATLYGIKNS